MLARPHNNCPLSWCPDDVIFYVLNFIRHDWIATPPRRTGRHAAAQALREPAGALQRRLSMALARGTAVGKAVMKMLTI